MEQKNNLKEKRNRGDNWSQQEKEVFLELMQQSALIVENKLSDTNSNKKKNMEWIKIQSKCNSVQENTVKNSESQIIDDEVCIFMYICVDQQNVSFVEKVVTVADVHNCEINKTCDNVMVPPKEVREETKTKPQKKTGNQNSKSSLIEANLEGKKRSIALLAEEYKLKIEFQKRELAHQEQRQKIEIDLLMMEKEKKALEIQVLKKKIQE
ncbi:hypothetical protein HF086_015223 [Spodoptera exigua]|uniref:Regulatory protein zeste n=1 Tax=Spodoptera exigua TaxID=7107 RepID=A0A922SBP8_SPOEX|nr:hypothetical protein HF086_015223 [Spodoptera exigua]